MTKIEKLRSDLSRERDRTQKLEYDVVSAEYFEAALAEARDRNNRLATILHGGSPRRSTDRGTKEFDAMRLANHG